MDRHLSLERQIPSRCAGFGEGSGRVGEAAGTCRDARVWWVPLFCGLNP
jgi:hypothetical protein